MSDSRAFKFGKRPATEDERDLKLAAILKRGPVPTAWMCGDIRGGKDMPCYDNDRMGNCVIAGRAHQQRIFEMAEHNGRDPHITTEEVVTQYLRESGGVDSGLYVRESLGVWRKDGWIAGGKREHCSAYAAVNWRDRAAVMRAVFTCNGLGVGFLLPETAMDQFDRGQVWTYQRGSPPNPYMGHYVYVCGYTPYCIYLVTWGRVVKASWRFLAEYADEAFSVIDLRETGRRVGIDTDALAEYLATRSPVVAT